MSTSHAGRTIISDREGGVNYTPASKPAKNMQPVVLARSRRAKLMRFASQPVTHKLSVTFVGTEAEVASFRARITALYDGIIGNLFVPGHSTVGFCAFTGEPGWSEQKRVEDGYMYTVDLEIKEL